MTSPSRQTYTFAAKDELSATLAKMAAGSKAVEAALDDLGDEATDAARSMTLAEKASAKVSRELAEQKRKVLELSAAYALLGDAADKGAKKELAAARSRQSELQKALKLMTPSGPPSPPGGGGGPGLFGQALGSPLIPAAVGAGILASPAIGAALNAALLAGLGTGALGLGIASAIRQDDTVKNEFKKLGGDFVDVFDEMGEPFVQPLRNAANFFRTELRGVSDDWTDSIGGLADLVEPLARGVAGFFKGITPGAMRALETAERVVDKLAEKLPGLGEDISTMFESFDQGGDGAVEAMGATVDVVGDLAVATGEVLEFLSKVFDVMTDIAQDPLLATELFGWWTPLLQGADSGIPKIKAAGDGLQEMGEAAAETEVDLKGLTTALDDLLDRFLNLDELQIRVQESIDGVRESFEENGRTMDINTEKGRANVDALLGHIEVLKDQRQANIDSGISISRANEMFEKQKAELYKLAASFGVSRAELDKWLAKYNTALLAPNITKSVNIKYSSSGSAGPASSHGVIQFYAEGGPVQRGVPVVVGDAGRPEVFVPDSDGYIHPDARRFAAGGGPVEIVLHQTIVTPDGRTVSESVQRYATQSGQRTLSQVFGLQAA